jgi:hypothetical protein
MDLRRSLARAEGIKLRGLPPALPLYPRVLLIGLWDSVGRLPRSYSALQGQASSRYVLPPAPLAFIEIER